MAARQDQGMQIFLIVLIFMSIVLAVATYIGWKSNSETKQRLAQVETNLRTAKEESDKRALENEEMRKFMGFGANDNFADVEKAYTADMERFGAAAAQDNRFYRTVLEAVFKEAADTAAREAESKKQYKELDARFAAREAETEKQIAEFKQKNKALDEDNANERRKFNESRLELENTKKELQTNLDKQRSELEGQIATRDEKLKAFEGQVAELQRAVVNWREQVPKDEESFEIPDGRITWVNQKDGTVWINVGEADSVRRQVTFNVYDADERDADRAVKKGSIEVTQVTSDHQAVARITQDDPTNPILTGDNIYSPVWHRGKKLRFALTGIVDFNNDGVSDLQLARELIELNGGNVDAYLGDDGKVTGEITAHTRYLVLGDFPESALRAGMQEGWQKMNQKATELGVETITLDQFVNRMGYTPQNRTVRLGEGASAIDFPARSGAAGRSRPEEPLPEADDKAAPKFRPRTPYGNSQKTPY